ncbi:aladin-like, partial [Tropilaelaps mercedesae]
MRLYSLAEFPTAPALGSVTLEETEGMLYNEPETPDVMRRFHKDAFPELAFIRVQDELARPSSTISMSAKSCILRQVPNDQWAQLYEAYVDHGLYGLLDHLSTAEMTAPFRVLSTPARVTLKWYHWAGRVYTFLRGLVFPQLQLSPEEICSKYSEVANWPSGNVRSLAWHPGTKKLAIALRNDSVILYTKNSEISSELKHPKQKNVTCVAFRPFSGSHIAVGCEKGLLLWNIPASIIVKTPTMHSASQFLPGTLISSIAWHPGGNLLAVCSARFGDIVVLNAATGETVPLTTFSLLPSAHLLRWSRDG